MADVNEVSSLFAAVVQWAGKNGAVGIDRLPGLWTGETTEWIVKLNGHRNVIDDVPPYGYLLMHKTAFAGAAIGNHHSGCVVGPTEDDLIAHFRTAVQAGDVAS